MSAKKSDSWRDLGVLWRAPNGVDAKALARKVRRKTRQMKIMLVVELALVAWGFGIGIWVLLRADTGFETGVGAFAILFSAIGLWCALFLRKGVWKAASESVADQLRLTYKRARAGVRYADFNLWGAIPAFLFIAFIVIHQWDDILAAPPGKQRLVFAVAIAGFAFLIGTVIWSVRHRARKKREAARLKRLLEEIGEDAG